MAFYHENCGCNAAVMNCLKYDHAEALQAAIIALQYRVYTISIFLSIRPTVSKRDEHQANP
jgi:hypothetical protein